MRMMNYFHAMMVVWETVASVHRDFLRYVI